MRVYIIGSHSCGKSTLARYVAERHKLPLLTEVARTILAEKELGVDALRTDLDITDEYQSAIFSRQCSQESSVHSFVSDRSFDCLAYAAQHSRILKDVIFSKEVEDYVMKLKEKDVYIFWVRPSRDTLKQDGVRESLSWDGVVAIDSMCKFMLEMWGLDHFQINTSSMQERVKLIDSILTIESRDKN